MHGVAMVIAVAITLISASGAVASVVAVPFAVVAVRTVLGGATEADLIPVLGATGRVQLLAGLAMAAGVAVTG